MSTQSDTRTADEWSLDPTVSSRADRGVPAARKLELRDYDAPLHVLDANGVEVPHRSFNPAESFEDPTSVELDGTYVHLHQDVRESMDEEFGDFSGLDDEDDEDVVWTVVDLADGTVTITVVGDWSKRRHVPFTEFPENYNPIYATDGSPRFGY